MSCINHCHPHKNHHYNFHRHLKGGATATKRDGNLHQECSSWQSCWQVPIIIIISVITITIVIVIIGITVIIINPMRINDENDQGGRFEHERQNCRSRRSPSWLDWPRESCCCHSGLDGDLDGDDEADDAGDDDYNDDYDDYEDDYEEVVISMRTPKPTRGHRTRSSSWCRACIIGWAIKIKIIIIGIGCQWWELSDFGIKLCRMQRQRRRNHFFIMSSFSDWEWDMLTVILLNCKCFWFSLLSPFPLFLLVRGRVFSAFTFSSRSRKKRDQLKFSLKKCQVEQSCQWAPLRPWFLFLF